MTTKSTTPKAALLGAAVPQHKRMAAGEKINGGKPAGKAPPKPFAPAKKSG